MKATDLVDVDRGVGLLVVMNKLDENSTMRGVEMGKWMTLEREKSSGMERTSGS